MKKKALSVHPAVLAVWSAVLAVASLLPSIPIIGLGSSFSVSTGLYPLAGMFFGPIPGAVCAAIGAALGMLIAPHTAWMGMATFLIGTVSAFAAGCVSRGKTFVIPVGILAVCGGLWFTFEIGRAAPMFPVVFYGFGVLACVAGGFLAKKNLTGGNMALKIVSVWLCAVAGMVTTASWANLVTLVLFQTPATVWNVLVFTSPVERACFAVGTTIIGVPLLVGLPKTGIAVGPPSLEGDEAELPM
ncbi:hypothetical protein SDC9_100633 [bioreactor metagenome]|uniref:ECF transporter S component n=1 Tax=bioreactor metagenome TaxID=1076179 RepID=A0A645ASL7_9ZZZZ